MKSPPLTKKTRSVRASRREGPEHGRKSKTRPPPALGPRHHLSLPAAVSGALQAPGASHGRDPKTPSPAGGGRGARPVSGEHGSSSEGRDGLRPGAPQHPRPPTQTMPGSPRHTTALPGRPATTCARRGPALTHRLLRGHHFAGSSGVGRYLEHRGTEGSGQNPAAAPEAARAPPARPRSPQTRRQDGRKRNEHPASTAPSPRQLSREPRARPAPPHGCHCARTAAAVPGGAGPGLCLSGRGLAEWRRVVG